MTNESAMHERQLFLSKLGHYRCLSRCIILQQSLVTVPSNLPVYWLHHAANASRKLLAAHVVNV